MSGIRGDAPIAALLAVASQPWRRRRDGPAEWQRLLAARVGEPALAQAPRRAGRMAAAPSRLAAVCLLLFALALVLASHLRAHAWQEEPAGEAYDQAAAGEQLYAEVCSACHGSAGEGGAGAALVGERRLAGFRTAQRLFDFVSTSMPLDAPGTLAEQEYYDVVAFLLAWNGLNPENLPVDASTIGDISLQ